MFPFRAVAYGVVLTLGCAMPPDGEGPLDCAGVAEEETVRCGVRHALAFLEASQVREDVMDGEPRLRGEWPSYFRWVAVRESRANVFYDSNAFVPLSILWPLAQLDDSALPAGSRRVTGMLTAGLSLLRERYVDGRGEVNFWPTLRGFHGPPQMAYQAPRVVQATRAIFDLPNDADDTALYYLVSARLGRAPGRGDFPVIFAQQTDGAWRSRQHERETWKPRASGAFLTWLTDERDPHSRQPASPLLPNTVDCVLQGNVLAAIGRERGADVEGYGRSCALSRRVMREALYPRCAHYYPGRWFFPYAHARAYATGANPCLAERDGDGWPLRDMLENVLNGQTGDGAWDSGEEFVEVASTHPEYQGRGRVLATALAVNTLYGLRSAFPEDTGRIDGAIETGTAYLLAHAAHAGERRCWQGGVFFSSSVGNIALWKSRSYTTAVVLEALVRRLLALRGQDGATGTLVLGRGDVPAEW